MVRIWLITVIFSTWVFIVLMGQFLPWASAVSLLFLLLFGYMAMVSIAMIHQKRKEKKSPKPLDTNYQPKISVVVPAHNEEAVIDGLVETMLKLDYPDYDLLVIDDRSTDNTPKRLQELSKRFPGQFQYHIRSMDSVPGKSAVLNEALTLTDGEIIAVFDTDTKVEPGFLSKLTPFLSESSVGGVQARKVIANHNANWLTRCQNNEYAMDSYFQCGRDTIRGAVEFRGNGQLVKREAVNAVGGWNELSLTDDLDLSTRFHLTGWDIRFAHRVHVFEEGILHLPALIRQRRRWGEGSLTRYLEYASGVLLSDKVSLRSRLDRIAYIVQFVFPLWLTSDYLYLSLITLLGNHNPNTLHVATSLLLLPLLSVFFFTMLSVAIVRFLRLSFFQVLFQSLLTSVYLTIVWVPVAFWITMKILLQKERSMDWGKTEHHGASEAA